MKLSRAWWLVGLAGFCVGCGGGADDGIGVESPYLGSYRGTWSAATTGGSGEATALVLGDGDLSGTLAANEATPERTLSGRVSASGNVSAQVGAQSMSGHAVKIAETGEVSVSLCVGSYNPENVILTLNLHPAGL